MEAGQLERDWLRAERAAAHAEIAADRAAARAVDDRTHVLFLNAASLRAQAQRRFAALLDARCEAA